MTNSRFFHFRAMAVGLGIAIAAGCGYGPAENRIELKLTESSPQFVPHWELVHRSFSVQSMSYSGDGLAVWAVGRRGDILRYQNGRWQHNTKASEEIDFPDVVWLSATKDVWIASGSKLYRLRGNQLRWWYMPVKVRENRITDAKYIRPGAAPDELLVARSDGSVLSFHGQKFEERGEGESSIDLLSVWLMEDGSSSWGVNSDGTLLRFNGEQWRSYWPSKQNSHLKLRDLAMTADGRYGTAVGQKGVVLTYQGNRWREDLKASALSGGTLSDVWLSPQGDLGWAVGENGVVLAYRAGQWQVDHVASALNHESLGAVWAAPDASRAWITDSAGNFVAYFAGGRWTAFRDPHWLTSEALLKVECGDNKAWALGRRGEVFSYENGKWGDSPATSLALSKKIFPAVWFNPGRERGWALGEKGVLRLVGGNWLLESSLQPLMPNEEPLAMAFSRDGERGWVFGDKGAALRYDNGNWKRDDELEELANASVYAMWLTPSGVSGWAASVVGGVFRIADGHWRQEDGLIGITALATVDGGASGKPKAWASTQGGGIYRFQGERWGKDLQASGTEGFFSYIWLSPDASSGWISGKKFFLVLRNGNWSVDREPGLLSPVLFRSICLSPDQKTGWSVGDNGTIIRFAPQKIGSAEIRPLSGTSSAFSAFKGHWALTFDAEIEGLPKLRLVDEQRGVVEDLSEQEYEVKRSGNSKRFTLQFNSAIEDLSERLQGSERTLEIEARIKHLSLPVVVTFRAEPFYVVGRPAWHGYAVMGLMLVAVNILLVICSARFGPVRTIVLNPVSSNLIGLVFCKYLLVDWLIRYVLPIKMAMFRDYRLRLLESQEIAAWRDGRVYIPPQVSVEKASTALGPVATVKAEEDAWSQILQQLLRSPRRRLWLVVGPSGLGKTALLENWTKLSLELGRTPFLIRLQQGGVKEQAAALMLAGDVNVNPDVAFDLLVGGGFIVLLDGFNEDNNPEETRAVVRRLAQRNLVIMTSQFPPSWKGVVDIHRIQLEPFGRSQLSKLLGEEWVEEVFARPALVEMARLPFTADLLVRFIISGKGLPSSELEAYADLWVQLDQADLLNLEETAWHLFSSMRAEFRSDEKHASEFCESAVTSGLLTVRTRESIRWYRFSHEKLHRLFVALWLDRQEKRALPDWYREGKASFGRVHWIDVLDFGGQLRAKRAIESSIDLPDYLSYMREVAEFSPEIFAQRLYPLYDRLCAAAVLPSDSEFVSWAARFLANALAPSVGP